MQQSFKYLFEEEIIQPIEKQEKVGISEEEALEREKISFEKGYQSAKQELEIVNNTEHDQKNDTYLELLQNINDKLTNKQYDAKEEKYLSDLAILIGKKLSSVSIEGQYYGIVRSFIHDIITEMNQGTPITIRVNNQLASG